MKIVFFNRYPEVNSILFTERNAPIGDDLLLPFRRLEQAAARRGIKCEVYRGEEDPAWWADALALVLIDRPASGVYSDPPTLPKVRALPCPIFLLAFENETILPGNWHNLGGFAKVLAFARAPSLDPERFVRLFAATDFDDRLPGEPYRGRRFATLVTSNKQNPDPRSIYRVRREVIEAFSHHPEFDLYGPGWPSTIPSWEGPIAPGMKRLTMSRYRFALCMENARLPDYVTEKLFDAMLAGAVPVYWGAPNVAEWVDSEAFIDGAATPDPHDLARKLASMSQEEWQQRRLAAGRWMLSDRSRPFRVSTFVTTILDAVLM